MFDEPLSQGRNLHQTSLQGPTNEKADGPFRKAEMTSPGVHILGVGVGPWILSAAG